MSADERPPSVAWVDRGHEPPGTRLDVYLVTWEDNIEYLIERGYTDDEIEDEFARGNGGSERWPSRAGEILDFGQLHDRRRVLALLTLARQHAIPPGAHGPTRQAVNSVPEGTPANVAAERERRRAAGEPFGYNALAQYFVLGPTTIRRRLGKTK